MTPEELRQRLTAFAVAVLELCRELRTNPEAWNVAEQLGRSATSVSANYRVASRARSRKEFVSKLAIALEEADETVGWLEIATRSGLARSPGTRALLAEGRQIVAILTASRRTAERRAT